MRAVKSLEAVSTSDVAAGIVGALAENSGIAIAPHVHRGDTVILWRARRISDSGIARYQFSAEVSAPDSAIVRASRTAASKGCLTLECMKFDIPLQSCLPRYRSGTPGSWKNWMYQDAKNCRGVASAFRNAAGCGTDPRDSGTRVVSDQVHPLSAIPPGTPWNNGYIESFDNRLREDCLNRNHWTSLGEARVVIGDFKDEPKRRHRHSALGYLTPAEYAARCRHAHRPVTCDINS